jgi:hypothetical protein
MGSAPMRAAMVVIMIGRNRTLLASRIACSGVLSPLLSDSIAKSIIMIAFFFTIPISMMMPTRPYMSRSSPQIRSVSSAPNAAKGSPERIVSGWMKLS